MTEIKRKREKINPEMLVGVSAVIIGICALGVSLYETRLMREEQRAAVMPLLELSRSYNVDTAEGPQNKSRLSLQAQNVGIGPARVMDFRVTVDEVAMPTWDAAMRALIRRDEPVSYGQSTINGRTIPPERSVTMMDLNDKVLTRELLNEFDRLDFEACFCSIFDECWTTSYSTLGVAHEVQSCKHTDMSFTE
jgi:uncharacterized protein (DUF433 family)